MLVTFLGLKCFLYVVNALNYLRPLICPAIAPAEAILTVKPWHCRMIKKIWIKGRFYCVGVVVAWFNCTLMSVLQGYLNLKVTTWSVGSVKTRFCFTTSSFFVSLWSKMIAQCNPRRLTAFRLVPYKLYLHTWRVNGLSCFHISVMDHMNEWSHVLSFVVGRCYSGENRNLCGEWGSCLFPLEILNCE